MRLASATVTGLKPSRFEISEHCDWTDALSIDRI